MVIVLSIIVIGGLIFCFTFNPNETPEEHKLKESLEDEFIYNPETGAKITLEQAESGNWLTPDEEIRKRNKEEQRQDYNECELEAEAIADELEKLGFKEKKFSEEEIALLDASEILKKYDDWSYSHPYINNQGIIVFFPSVVLHKRQRSESYFNESQLMFWVKINHENGHYYIREKSSTEKIFDMFRNDDDIKMEHYESYTIRRGSGILTAIRILQKFDNIPGLEAELYNDNLFIKNLKLPNKEDYIAIENLIKDIV